MRYIILVFIMLIVLVSCSQQTDESNNANEQPHAIEKTTNKSDVMGSNSEIADHLATIASDVPNVHDASSLVAGPYAVVAIDIDDMTERERVGTTKYSVTEALQHDPYGRTAVVIADADVMTRLREMGNDLRNGKPVKGIAEELANIVSRYMPTIPPNQEDIEKEIEQQPSLDEE